MIGGYTTVKGRGLGLGSLLLGVHRDGALAYVGRVGTGWDARSAEELRAALDPLRVDQPPFAGLPAAARRGARWVRPELVAEVQFQTWTADGLLRHASFQGLREDRAAAEVVPERPRSVSAVRSSGGPLELHGVRISSADRQVLDRPAADQGRRRPLLRRHGRPDPAAGGGPAAERHPLPGTARPGLLLPAPPRRRHAALGAHRPGGRTERQGALSGHRRCPGPAGAGPVRRHRAAPERCPRRPARSPRPPGVRSRPGRGPAVRAVVAAAHELQASACEQLGLESFPRTTGGKGLHLVVPIERRHDWAEAKAFAGGIARAMQADSPERYTAVLSKAARKGRIFIDYLRNDRTATAVASYSLRGRASAPVAMPLGWAEVTPRSRPAGVHHPDRRGPCRPARRSVGRHPPAAAAVAVTGGRQACGLTCAMAGLCSTATMSHIRLQPLRSGVTPRREHGNIRTGFVARRGPAAVGPDGSDRQEP